MKVLVVERQTAPGGYASAFRRGPYIFDPAIHVTGQGAQGQLYDNLLGHLGVRDRCTLLPLAPLYGGIYPNLQFYPPVGIEPFIEAHIQQFPHESQGIRQFFDLCDQVHREAHNLPPQVSFRDLDETVKRFPTLFTYVRATVGEVLDECLSDLHAKALCTAAWPYLGLPPSRLAFVTFAQMLFSQIDGAFYFQGSFQTLVDALVASLEHHGGKLALGTKVDAISVQDGHVTGVTLAGGREIRTATVLSNADARQTLEQFVGVEHLPQPYVRRLQRMEPCLSGFVVYVATSMDVRPFVRAHETFVYKHWNHDDTYQDILAGTPGGTWLNTPTLVDPSLAPPGEHLVIYSALVPYDVGVPWAEAKERFTDLMLAEMEGFMPGLRSHLTLVETATPLTFEEYTLSYRGSAYGWAMTPDQIGSKRLSQKTPVAGLYLVGAWTQPGAASLRVVASGIQSAFMILRDLGRGELDLQF
jgi:prolycopene isomerase